VTMARFSLAFNRRFKNRKTDEWEETTAFIDGTAFARNAEKFLEARKGSLMFVHGYFETESWENKEGQRRFALRLKPDFVLNIEQSPAPDHERFNQENAGYHSNPVFD
jgi:single-strand DNA-binding protein